MFINVQHSTTFRSNQFQKKINMLYLFPKKFPQISLDLQKKNHTNFDSKVKIKTINEY